MKGSRASFAFALLRRACINHGKSREIAILRNQSTAFFLTSDEARDELDLECELAPRALRGRVPAEAVEALAQLSLPLNMRRRRGEVGAAPHHERLQRVPG